MQQYTLKQIKKGHIASKQGIVQPSSLSLTVVKQVFRKNRSMFYVQRSFPYMPSQLLLVNSLGTLWISGCILGTSRFLIPTFMLNFSKTQGCHSPDCSSLSHFCHHLVLECEAEDYVPPFQGIQKDQIYSLKQLIKKEPNRRYLLPNLTICHLSILPVDLC